MSGATIQLDATIKDRRVIALLERIDRHMADATPAFTAIGEIVQTSIQRNFNAGGRPDKWEKSRRAKQEGGQTLIDRAILKNSINVRAGKDFAQVGTADRRAAVHHFGAQKGSFGTVAVQVGEHLRNLASGKTVTVKAHTRRQELPWGDIPARPFMLVQDEDWGEIVHTLTDFLTRI